VKFLLDTNVVSAWARLRPNAGVAGWLSECDEDSVFLSVISIAELRHGIERLSAGRRRGRLDAWLGDELLARFEGGAGSGLSSMRKPCHGEPSTLNSE
jgi:predicted nucleic acid-binding protein